MDKILRTPKSPDRLINNIIKGMEKSIMSKVLGRLKWNLPILYKFQNKKDKPPNIIMIIKKSIKEKKDFSNGIMKLIIIIINPKNKLTKLE